MPIFKIDELDLRANTPRYAMIVHAIHGLMLYPEDKTGRDTFAASALSHRLGEINRELGFRAFGVEIDLNRPDIEIRTPEKILDEAMRDVVTGRASHPDAPRFSGPQVAAEILLEAITLSRADSLGKGVTIRDCLKNISAALGKKASVSGAHPDDLNKTWRAYRRSAPLTLAFMSLSKVFGEHEFTNEPENLVLLCKLSNDYMVEGEGIRHRNAEHPILPRGESWELLIRPRGERGRTLPQKLP